jgi:hypothetical protein
MVAPRPSTILLTTVPTTSLHSASNVTANPVHLNYLKPLESARACINGRLDDAERQTTIGFLCKRPWLDTIYSLTYVVLEV